MSANITDYFNKASNMSGAYPPVATVTAARSAGGSTLTCDDLAGWATDTPVHFSTFQVTASGDIDYTTQTDWKGIVVGNTVTEMTRLAGAADSGNASGDKAELNPTIGWLNDLVTGLLVAHKQNGGLKDNAVTEDSITTGAVTSGKIADSAVTTAKIADTSITIDKLKSSSFGAFSRYINGSQSYTAWTGAVCQFNDKDFNDIGCTYDSSAHTITITQGGIWLLNASANTPTGSGEFGTVAIRVNTNTVVASSRAFTGGSQPGTATTSTVVKLSAGDVIDVFCAGSANQTNSARTAQNFSGICLIKSS